MTCSAERLIKPGAGQHDAAKWRMFNHIIPVLRHCVDVARGCRCVQVRVVIAMIAVMNYALMSVDDLQMWVSMSDEAQTKVKKDKPGCDDHD